MTDVPPPRFILDTHVVVRWFEASPKLSTAHRKVVTDLERRGHRAAISAITLWELAFLIHRGRLRVDMALEDFLSKIETHPSIELLPITSRVAAESTRFGPEFPSDPADRIIAATARCYGLTLLTDDEAIRESRAVRVR